jgi:4a-hydroxytetrahydrobiopterin dehydratase
MTTKLSEKQCVPCHGGVPPLIGAELEKFRMELPEWQVVGGHHLLRVYTFPDFRTALDFVNQVGALAEEQGHHPDLALSWGRVEVKIYTHKINGLAESDFVLAAKIDALK